MSSTKTHDELRAELVGKAVEDDDFRAWLISDPKAAIKEALGIAVPDSVSVAVHEDSATSAHLVLPPTALLSETDLEAISAGDPSGYGKPFHKHGDGELH